MLFRKILTLCSTFRYPIGILIYTNSYINDMPSTPILQNRKQGILTPTHQRRLSSCCPNHPDKAVTHTLINTSQPSLSYCQKCSIMLASQGFNVVKISSVHQSLNRDSYKSERREQVDVFVGELAMQIEMIRERGMKVQEELAGSEEQYGRAMNEVTAFFQQIQTVLEIQKYKAYNSILGQRAKTEQELRAVRDALSSQLEGLLGMEGDIENNMEAVESVDEQVYQTIMQNYKNKLNVSYQIEDLQIQSILTYPGPIIADIPRQLFSLAEKITHSNTNSQEQLQLTSRQMPHKSKSHKSSKMTHCQPTHMFPYEELNKNNYSFDQYEPVNIHRRQLIRQTNTMQLMPNEMALRESLNLTEIRENEEEGLLRRFSALEEAIPEELQSSQESIDGYLAVDSLRQRKGDSRRDDTETLLLC